MKMTEEEVFEKLKEILSSMGNIRKEVIEKAVIDSKLKQDLGLDSIAMLYLVISIEETFKIQFENVGISSFNTVKDVTDYIVSHQ